MLQALGSNLIVKRLLKQKAGNIIIPQSAMKYKQYDVPVPAEVVSVGKDVKLEVKPGDTVYFVKHEGFRFIRGGEEYLKLKERWVMGKEGKCSGSDL